MHSQQAKRLEITAGKENGEHAEEIVLHSFTEAIVGVPVPDDDVSLKADESLRLLDWLGWPPHRADQEVHYGGDDDRNEEILGFRFPFHSDGANDDHHCQRDRSDDSNIVFVAVDD